MYLSSHFRAIARKALRGFWALTIGVTLVAVLLGGGLDFTSGAASGGRMGDRYQYSDEYSVYIEGPVFGSSLFSRFCIWGRAFGLWFMTSLLTFLWTLLFIVPGIVASYRYALAPYLMAENPDMGVMEAIARSKELMNGNKWRLFCLDLSFIGWTLLCVLTLGIGCLWLLPYQNAAEAAFYLEVTGRADAMPRPDSTMDAE